MASDNLSSAMAMIEIGLIFFTEISVNGGQLQGIIFTKNEISDNWRIYK
jgi:hypothetical protein